MAYVGWPTGVNKHILDSATIKIGGDLATKTDTLETGKKRSRLTVTNAPKTFNVSMWFDNVERDANGLTEKDRFFRWYEHILKYSVNEFQFPDLTYGLDAPNNCWYRITSDVSAQKSGLAQMVNMTWESVYEGTVNFAEKPIVVDHIEAENGACIVYLTDIPETSPTSATWTLLVDGEVKTITDVTFFDSAYAILYFDKYTDGNTHICKLENIEVQSASFRGE